jgi:hypothetical protein
MKPRININWKRFWLNFGWYPGNDFELFTVGVGRTVSDYPSGIASVGILHIQIAKFLLAFGWSND